MTPINSNRESRTWAMYFTLIMSGLILFSIYNIEKKSHQTENETVEREQGRTIVYGQNGQVLMQEIIVQDSFIERKTWYPNGKPKTEIHFTKGFLKNRLNGEKIEWYENGVKKSHYYFLNDKPNGTIREWYSSGHLKKIGFYSNGNMCGRYQEWHQNGFPAIQGMFQFGKKQGMWAYWDENGKRLRTENYEKK